MAMGRTFDLPDDPKEQEKIAGVIKDISNAMPMIEAKRDYIKEAKKALKEDHELPSDAITLMVKLYHAQSNKEYFEKQEDMEALYDSLFGTDGDED